MANPVITSVSPSSGSAGTQVTIGGSGFTGATAVTFGGKNAASFTVNSDTQITAITPSGAGTVDVEVIVPAPNTFTYLPPVVTAVSPQSGDENGDDQVTITGSGFTGATAVHFSTLPAAQVSVVSDTQITCMSPPHVLPIGIAHALWVVPGTVYVTVTTPAGTSAPSAAASFTYTGVPEPA